MRAEKGERWALRELTASDQELIQRAGRFAGWGDYRELTVEVLAKVAREQGLEFATALAYARVWHSQSTRELMEEMDFAPERLGKEPLFVIVPGAFYKRHRNTGADGGKLVCLIEQMGGRAVVVPVNEFGRVKENAEILLQWLGSRGSERLVVVSLSKGSAEVKYALGRDAGAFEQVESWLSLSGIVEGTALVNWLKQQVLRSVGVRLLLWAQGHKFATVEDLAHGPGTLLENWPELPERLRATHVCGMPLKRHLTHRWAPRGYERLAARGPNDGGGILLGDLGKLPGQILPVWGVDHYLSPLWEGTALLRKLLATVAGEVRQVAR